MISDRTKLFPSMNNQIPPIPERKINDSEKQSIELFNIGKNMNEIANIHNPKLSISTIWKHIEKGVSLHLIPADKFLSNEGYVEIESAIKEYIKGNYILERLKPIYKSLKSKYRYEQIRYAIYNFAKKVEYSDGTVKLHPFIDGWLQSRGAYYEKDSDTVQDGTRLNENGVMWYLGSIFPKSFAESYSIYYDLLSNKKCNEKLLNSKSIKILDIGGGTGGNVAGVILAIINKLPNIQEIAIDAYDPSVKSRDAYTDLISYINKILSCYIHINLQCDHLMLQSEYDDPQNGSYTFNGFSKYLAESKKSYDLIMSFKMINELINNGGFGNMKPYYIFLESLCPLLNESGTLILEDVSGDEQAKKYYCKMLNQETKDYLGSQQGYKVLSPIPCAIKQGNCKSSSCFMQQQVTAIWECNNEGKNITSKFAYKIISHASLSEEITPKEFAYRYHKVKKKLGAKSVNTTDHWCYPGNIDMDLEEKDAFKIGDYGREDNNN